MRYAIYYVPEEGQALARFGAAWFAREAEHLAAPRRYGFHATLKAPFRLAPERDEAELLQTLDRFAAARPPLSGPPLRPARLDGFLALMTAGPFEALDRLAADCVRTFDDFRAPPTDRDRERAAARAMRLTERQRALQRRWGYPHVMDAFRFHMTLTDASLDEAAFERERALAASMLGERAEPLRIDALTVMVEPGEGRAFELCHRAPLTGPPPS